MIKKIILYIALLLLSAVVAHAATVNLTLNSNIDYACGGCSQLTFTDNTDNTVYINPAGGYMVDDVLVDSVSVGSVASYTFVNITGTHTLSATAVTASYMVMPFNGFPNGQIIPGIGPLGPYAPTDSPEFTIVPDSGYQVANVFVNGVSIGPSTKYSFEKYGVDIIRTTYTISATFEPYSARSTAGVMLKWDFNPSWNNVTGYKLYYGKSPGNRAVAHGSQTVYFTPDSGYVLDDILVDSVSVGVVRDPYLISHTLSNIAANHTVSAVFSPFVNYTITASSDANGSISQVGAADVSKHQNITYTMYPNAGFAVSSVLVDSVSVGAVSTYTFTDVTAAHTISVTYAAVTYYTIAASSGANGSVTPTGSTSVASGANQAYAIIPDTGYKIADVLVDSVSVGAVPEYTFSNVTAGHTISATFNAATYQTITASAGANGIISPTGATSVTTHNNQEFFLYPDAGYRVATVLVDSSSVGAVTYYKFSNVTAGHTIAATFEAIPTYTIAASAGANGSISPIGNTVLNQGSSQTYAISPALNYQVSSVLVDSVSVGAVTSYTFTNVTAGHTISATFAPATYYTITLSPGSGGTLVAKDAVMQDVYVVTVGNANQYALTNIDMAQPIYFAATAYKTGPPYIESGFSTNLACYVLTPVVPAAGSISPAIPVIVSNGMSQVFAIDHGAATILDVLVDGASKGALTSLTIDNASQGHTIAPIIGNLVIGAGHQIGASSGGSRR